MDNKNNGVMCKIEVAVDINAPEVNDIKVIREDEITLSFNEALNKTSAENKGHYVLTNENGVAVKRMINNISYTGKEVTITFKENLLGDYLLTLEGIEDQWGNKMVATPLTFTVADLTKPNKNNWSAKLYNAGESDQMIKIDFNEKMALNGYYSILDITNYIIDGMPLYKMKEQPTLTAINNGSSILIEIPNLEDGGVNLSSGMNKVEIARVADAAGNYTTAFSNTIELKKEENILIDSVKATDPTTIEVTFNDTLMTFNPDDLLITTYNTSLLDALAHKLDISKITKSLNNDHHTVITLTMDNALEYDLSIPVYAYIVKANPSSMNAYGETLLYNDYKQAADSIIPTIATQSINGKKINNIRASIIANPVGVPEGTYDTITLSFTEAINPYSVSIVTFEVEGYDVMATNIIDNTIQLVLNEDIDALPPEVETEIKQIAPILDMNRNYLDGLILQVEESMH